MPRYSHLLGRHVEVHYRANDIFLPAVGTLVADSGKSVFLEEQFTQHGEARSFRWEIPYHYIVRVAPSGVAAERGDIPAAQVQAPAACRAGFEPAKSRA